MAPPAVLLSRSFMKDKDKETSMNLVDFISSRTEALQKRLTPRRFYPLLLGILTALGLACFLMPGLPNGHDLYYHFSRLHAMEVNFRLWEIPSMINHEALVGYGYATGLFYSDLFLYPCVFLMLCGMGIVAAYKCLIFAWMLFIAYSAYFCARKLSASPFGAFAAALLYTWSSYLADDLFIRAALGEFLVFAFMPWIILGLYELIFGKPERFFYFSFGFLGLVCSHNLSLLMLTVICGVIIAFHALRFLREPRRLLFLAISPIPVLLAGMAFLVPMLEQLGFENYIIKGEQNANILDRCMPFLKLFLEIPTSKPAFWIPSGIGITLLLVALQRLRLTSRRTSIELFRDMLLIAGVACLLMSTEMPSWKGAFKPLAVIQFPWRFFGPATAFLAFGGGLTLASLVGNDWPRERYWLWILIVGTAFAWFVNVGYFYAARISEHDITRGFRSGRIQEASGIHYLIRDGLWDDAIRARGDVVTPAHPLDFSLSRPQVNILELSFSGNTSDNDVEVPLVPYLGYCAEATPKGGSGGRCYLPTGTGPNKLLSVRIPHEMESGVVRVYYKGTFLQHLSQVVSILSMSALVVFLILRLRRKWAAKGE
jgi:hypothetical protein